MTNIIIYTHVVYPILLECLQLLYQQGFLIHFYRGNNIMPVHCTGFLFVLNIV
ncbi:hypothetical protein [Salmonella phage SD-1_S14]|nr:hypothetical protein [Salmonella phage SD-1_S14]